MRYAMLHATHPRRFILAALLLAAAPMALQAHIRVSRPRVRHDPKHQVAALEEQWRTATLSGDVTSLDKLLADDYIGITATGEVNTKSQQLDRMRKWSRIVTAFRISDMKVKMIDSTAIVTSRAEVDTLADGVLAKAHFRYTRVYHHLPSGSWQVTNFEATRIPEARRPGQAPSQQE